MKKLYLTFFLLSLLPTLSVYAQKKIDGDSYRRSSICMILVDEANMPRRDLIKDIFLEAPVPDKYNDHNPDNLVRYFNPANYTISKEDRETYKTAMQEALDATTDEGKKPKKARMGGFGATVRTLGSIGVQSLTGQEATALFDDNNLTDYGIKSLKYINDKNLAKQLFDRWFIDEDGNFTEQLMIERGLYDAAVADVRIAKNTLAGTRLLGNAGQDLVNNTFVVISRFRYVNKDDLAKEFNAVGADDKAAAGTETSALAKGFLGDGYYVRVTSFLFQLDWNEDIQNKLYEAWDDMAAYNSADIFRLKYVGQETAFANVKQSVFAKSRPEEELIKIATINAQDAVLGKLEKKYDVFKTKTPLVSVEPLYAEIGLKEGLQPGDRFEVLEKEVDEQTGYVNYKRKGVIKVANDGVWDNRFGADVMVGQALDETLPQATLFESVSGNGFYPGMLIRQIK